MIYDGLSDEGKSADLAVVMGNKVNENGTLSERLKQRLDCSLKLYQNNRVPVIMVSGGLGKEGFYEGDKMKDYLIARGVPDSSIIVDNYGNNTRSSVSNSIVELKNLEKERIIVVSQYFHLTRSKKIYKEMGVTEISGSSPFYFEWRDFYSLFREFIAFYFG